jgi:hypothetical protein
MKDELSSVIQIDYNKDGESVRYIQTRGVETIDLSLENPITRPLPFERLDELVETARAELKAAREQTDLDILNATNDPKAIHSAFRKVIDGLNERRTPGSQLRKAAQFLAQWNMLKINLRLEYPAGDSAEEEAAARKKTEEARIDTAYFFADAWYHWCREVDGGHVRAYRGQRAAESEDKRDAGRDAKAEKRKRIILEQVGHLLRDGMDILQIAVFHHDGINRALERENLKPIPIRQPKDKDKPPLPDSKKYGALIRELYRIKEQLGAA